MKTDEMIEELSNRKIIKLSNRLCKAKFDIKEVSLNIFMLLLTEISKEDTELRGFYISVLDIEKKLGKKFNRTPGYLESICKALTEKNVCLHGDTEFISLCLKCELIKQRGKWFMQIQINPKLHESLIALSSEFTQINLDLFLQLKGLYEKRMYMILKSTAGLKFWKVGLADIYEILQVSKAYTQKYDNFKRRVLEKSMRSINELENSDIQVSYSIGNNLKMLTFKVERLKTQKSEYGSKQTYERKNMNMEEWELACAGKLFNDDEEMIDTEVVEDSYPLQNVVNG